jgi:tetratricopeptide (TPR) repeat protein
MYERRVIMPLISNKQKAFEGDVVELFVDIPAFNVKRGQRGIVITSFDEPEAYDLELEDESGDFMGFAYSINPDQFTNLSRNAFVRAMEAVERVDLVTAERELRTATDLRPDYIGGFVMSILATVPKGLEERGFAENVSYLIPLLRLANRVDPTYEFARFNLAVAFLNFGVAKARKKSYHEAIELFYSAFGIRTDLETEALIKTNIVKAFTALAKDAFQDDRVEEGFGYIRTAFLVLQDETTRRNLGLAYGNLGVFYMKSQLFEFALKQFERAEDSGVILPEYLNDRGVCLVFLGRINEAIGVFERVLEIDPQNDNAQYNLIKLKQMSEKESSTSALEAFADQFFIAGEDLADFDGQIPEQMAWRQPPLSAKEFAFA